MIKLKLFGMLTGAALLAGVLFALFGFAPVSAQADPAAIGDLSLIKYVCPTNVGGTGTSIPGVCANANDPNGSDVPVIPVNGAVSFIYRVTYSNCPLNAICEPLDPISVTIEDTQLPTTTPTEYGPELDANSNGLIDIGDVWLYKVNGLQAIDLAAATVLPNGTPVPSGCAAAQGGSRPTYVNQARVLAPSASQFDPAAYCNPQATATPTATLTPTPTGTQSPTPTPTPTTPVPRPTDSPARPVEIPEPITVVLFGTGLAALSAALAARKRSAK